MRIRSWSVALTVVLVGAVVGVPAAAQGAEGLIAFESRYDQGAGLDRIEVVAPDGSGRRVVVDDAASPALSPDGTQVAFQRAGDILVADLATGQESLVSADPGFENSPAWSPDGSLLAYRRAAPPGPDCTHLANAELIVHDLDGTGARQLTDTPCLTETGPDFSPDGTRIAFANFYIQANFTGAVSFIGYADLQTGGFTQLTGAEEGFAENPAWSPDGSRIAYNGLNALSTKPVAGGPATDVIGVADLPDDCGGASLPDWSPDGSLLVLTLLCDDGDIATVPAAGGAISRLVTDGDDSHPSWSGTAQPPGPTPPPGGGGSTPPEPDEPLLVLEDGLRVDGGGAADPVGQAIATSQVWDDGGAGLVVLATAQNFPDALAGSALAGERGPILVTPFGDALDPRVAAEIDRVLPDDGIVLILGGTAAVTEGAAAEARAAAGSATCPAPFPADCRYAGSGREHTAALIGQTVLALNGGSGGRALLARGDQFADAITGGAYAAEAGVPILLTPSDQLNAATRDFISANGIGEVIVLGGTAAVSDPVVAAVPTQTRRIAGGERTATAAAIATQLWDAEGLAGGGIVLVNVRDADGWQTALAAAVISAVANAPQLGVENPPTGPSSATLDAAAQLGGPVETYGSAALVGDDQVAAVRSGAG